MKISLIILLIISIGIIVYSNSLGNDFVWDDETFIIMNDYIKNLSFAPLYFTSRYALASGDLAHENYRPFLPLSYAIDYFVWKLDPMGYHLTNLVFHVLNALLLFYVVILITKDRYIAFFSSLIFLTHPVQTEAVTWISGRADVMFLFFFLSSFILYIKYGNSGKLFFYSFSLLSFIFALFSKEMAASLLFVFILYDWLYGKEKRLGPRVIAYFPFLLVLGLYILIRFAILGRFAQTGYWTGDFYTTFLSMLKGVMYYIKVLLYPVGLCADHLTFPISRSIKDPLILFSLFVIMALLALSFFLAKRMKNVSFSILLFFITLAPVANIIPIKILIAERFLYLPLAGFAVLVAAIVRFFYIKFSGKPVIKYPLLVFSAALIFVYSSLTLARNHDWADEVVFNEKIIEVYPDNPRAHYNLAFALMRREGDLRRSHEELKKTIQIMPEHYRARMLLASQYVYAGRPEDAINELKRVIEIKPELSDAYKRLAYVYEMQEKYDNALGQYERLLAWDPLDLEANAGIANLYALRGEEERSTQAYKQILSKEELYRGRPQYAVVYLELGSVYASTGKSELAGKTWSEIYKRLGGHTILGRISGFLADNITLEELLEAMEGWPQKYKVLGFYYIGVKKELEGDLEEAKAYYKKCLEVPTKTIEHAAMLAGRKLKK
ncbi:MAG: tetratricopeptide repeat protein, partial [Candidatus Omnitrophota bacterium]